MTNRHTLEVDLLRHQESGDLAAQAGTLMALAETIHKDTHNDDYDSWYGLVHGLYGQAWAAYERAGHKGEMARAVKALADVMEVAPQDRDDTAYIEYGPLQVTRMYELALSLYIELGDLREQADIHYVLAYRTNDTADMRTIFESALACYVAMDDKEEQARTYMSLAYTYSVSDPERYSLMEQAASLYQQANNRKMEAATYYEMGRSLQAEKDYTRARSSFEMAQAICLLIRDHNLLAVALLELSKIISEIESYAAYCRYREEVLRQLDIRYVEMSNLSALWSDFSRVAYLNKDFFAARHIYQQTLIHSVFIGRPWYQPQIYCEWGWMEYHHAGCKEMGYALYLWGTTLMEHYFPEHASMYRDALDHMRQQRAS